ncbi:hypothetical protein KC686_04160, partial [Candidatus Woesebacteria bacterium]|nr:hypothetical protein [Candidatus Woesebacteria bacterium]
DGNSFGTLATIGTNDNQSLAFETNGAEKMRILANGNVGIGTTSPDSKFDILDASNPQIRLTHTDGSVYTDLQTTSSGNLNITPSNPTNPNLTIKGNNPRLFGESGNLTLGVASTQALRLRSFSVEPLFPVKGVLGSASAPSFSFFTDDDTGLFRANTDALGFTTAGTERVRIDASGNVGIGTTSPSSLLSVGASSQFQVNSSGDIVRIKNLNYLWPSSHTTNGVLTNNGSGTLTWGTIGSSGITADSLNYTE